MTTIYFELKFEFQFQSRVLQHYTRQVFTIDFFESLWKEEVNSNKCIIKR